MDSRETFRGFQQTISLIPNIRFLFSSFFWFCIVGSNPWSALSNIMMNDNGRYLVGRYSSFEHDLIEFTLLSVFKTSLGQLKCSFCNNAHPLPRVVWILRINHLRLSFENWTTSQSTVITDLEAVSTMWTQLPEDTPCACTVQTREINALPTISQIWSKHLKPLDQDLCHNPTHSLINLSLQNQNISIYCVDR